MLNSTYAECNSNGIGGYRDVGCLRLGSFPTPIKVYVPAKFAVTKTECWYEGFDHHFSQSDVFLISQGRLEQDYSKQANSRPAV